MSIVEKAAEKLKALRSSAPASSPAHAGQDTVTQDTAARDNAAAPVAARPSIERLQQRQQVAAPERDDAPLWHLDPAVLEQQGYLPANHDGDGRLKDELRRIKRPLLANAKGRGAKVPPHPERIVVTSACPDEGKTFTTLNLALSMAREPDFEVLLIDGDTSKACLTHAFGLKDKPGLMDILADERLQPADVVVRTDVPGLLAVPAGQRHPLTAELFGSRRMEEVLNAFGGHNRRRLLLFDSPPLLATSESQALVMHMGQIIMVVAARHTRQQALNASLRCLNGSQYVGLVLNMSQLPASEAHYDDGYGY